VTIEEEISSSLKELGETVLEAKQHLTAFGEGEEDLALRVEHILPMSQE